MSNSTTMSSRKPKWPHPPPPSPKILHFPTRTRIRTRAGKHQQQPNSNNKPTTHHHDDYEHGNNPLLAMHQKYLISHKGLKLENLFDQENDDDVSPSERRVRVEEQREEYSGGGGFEEERWRFQAEILRAECNFLRMEREFALKKLERNRVKMERTLTSAVNTLVSKREKNFEGKNVNAVLDEEIEDLAEKLEELRKSSRVKDPEVKKCSNFDKKASVLQRRLEKLGGLSGESSSLSVDTIRDSDRGSKVSDGKTDTKSTDMDVLNKKMEGLSKGVILDRLDQEYGSVLSITPNSSVASSASTSKRIHCPEISSFSTRHFYQESMLNEENKCSGRCKAIVRRIAEQVRAETEQWSQMQEMLRQVRGEMEELQASRHFWENRAHSSEYEIQSLKHTVEEWKEKALSYENKANQLQDELSALKEDARNLKAGRDGSLGPDAPAPMARQLEKEKLAPKRQLKKTHHHPDDEQDLNIEDNKVTTPTKDLPPISLGTQLAKEKMFLRRSKENHNVREKDRSSKEEPSADGRRKLYSNSLGVIGPKPSPLRDIANSTSPLTRQISRAAFLFLSPESSRSSKSFRT